MEHDEVVEGIMEKREGEGGRTACSLPLVPLCTRFIWHLISTVLQSFQAFLPVKCFYLMSNPNLATCNFGHCCLLNH